MRTKPPTGNAIPSLAWAIRGPVPSLLQASTRFQKAALASAVVCVAVLGVVGGVVEALLGAIALAALAAAYQRPYLVGPFVALLLPAGERLDVLQAQVAPLEAVVGGGAIGYLLGALTRRDRLRLGVADWIFVVFLAFVALSALGPVDESDRVREALFWVSLGIAFHAVATHFESRRDLRLMLVALGAATLVESSVALFEYVSRWSERFSLLGGAIVYPLPEGTLGHPNALAGFLVLATLAVLALALSDGGVLGRLGLLASGVAILALVVTFSRASWIALAVGAAVYLVDRRTRRPVIVVGTVALLATAATALVGGAIGERISSLFRTESSDLYGFRLELVERAARIAADNPLTGIGHFEEVGVYAGRPDVATHPHNLFLGIAVFFGVPAALAFAGLVFVAFRAAWRGYRERVDERRLTALGLVATLVALVVHGVFEYPFWNPSLAALVVLVLAMAIAFERPSEPRNSAN